MEISLITEALLQIVLVLVVIYLGCFLSDRLKPLVRARYTVADRLLQLIFNVSLALAIYTGGFAVSASWSGGKIPSDIIEGGLFRFILLVVIAIFFGVLWVFNGSKIKSST